MGGEGLKFYFFTDARQKQWSVNMRTFFFFFKQPGLIYFAVRNMIRDAPRVCLHCFNVRAAHQGSTRFCLESMCGENVAEETLQIK